MHLVEPTKSNARTWPLEIRWEEAACPLCQGDDAHLVTEAPDWQTGTWLRFAIVQCKQCTMCYTHPRPDRDSLHRFYPHDYEPYRETGSGAVSRRLRRLFPHLLRPWGNGRLLDIGCGAGRFLLHMRAHGWQVSGLDIAPAPIEHLRRQFGLDAHVGTLPAPQWPAHSFQIITLWQVLEHVPEPRIVLRECARLLTGDGRLLVSVPNWSSLSCRFFGPAWIGLDLPRHLNHFSADTLAAMLERCGLIPLRIFSEARSGWVRRSARVAQHMRHRAKTTWLLRYRWPSRLFALYSHRHGAGDCLYAEAIPASRKNRPT